MDPIPAREFVNSIGINIHPNWRRTIWQQADWETPLLELGVRNVRGLVGSGSSGADALRRLGKLFGSGIKLCATVAPHAIDFDLPAIAANLDFLAKNVGPANLCGIESANEYNQPRLRRPDWAIRLRQFQAWLYEAVRANPKLNAVPVVGPSLWRAVAQDVAALGSLEPYVDKACMHYYTGGRRPTRTGRPPLTFGADSVGEYSLGDAAKAAQTEAPSKRIFATEFGYAVAGRGEAPTSFFIPETAAAKYLVRGLMDLFAAGVEKIFIYSLIDDVHREPPVHHGLLDGAMRPRMTYFAVRNFLRLMQDPGPEFAPQRFAFTLTAVPTMKTMVFQKSDGSVLVALYQDVDSYDRVRKVETTVAPAPVTLSLPRPASRIEVFRPGIDLTPRQSVTNSSTVHLAVDDDVTVAKIAL